MSRTIPTSERIPAFVQLVLDRMSSIARHGHPTTAMWVLHACMRVHLESYLDLRNRGLDFQELVDLVASDGNRFKGKAELMEALRLFDARVTTALNEQGPGAWERANAILAPHVEETVAFIRKVLPCLFDFSLMDGEKDAAEGSRG